MIPPLYNQALESGSYAATFEFAVEDRSGPFLDLTPTSAPTIRADTTAAIHRTLSGLTIPADQRARIDPISNRVRVTMILHDGTRWPCGVFAWATGSAQLASTNTTFGSSLYDLGILFDRPITYTIGVDTGDLLTDALAALVTSAGVDAVDIWPSDQRAGAPLNWPAGTNLRQVLGDITNLLAYTPVYFDGAGVARAHRHPPLQLGGHDYSPTAPARVVGGTINEGLITAPGAFLVIGTGVTSGEVVAYSEVPATNPLNPQRRRATRTEIIRANGITDTRHAQAVADGAAQRTPSDYRTVTLETVLDPRHDLFETVDYALPNDSTEPWRETAFSFACGPEWRMTHQLAKGLAA